MQFNLVNNKEMLVFSCIWVHDGAVCLAVSSPRYTCTGSCKSCSLRIADIWKHLGKSIVWYFLQAVVFSIMVLLFFCFPPTTLPFFSLSTVIIVWQVPGCPCVGAYGWFAGIASHGSVLLSRAWLIAVEACGHLINCLPLNWMQLLNDF